MGKSWANVFQVYTHAMCLNPPLLCPQMLLLVFGFPVFINTNKRKGIKIPYTALSTKETASVTFFISFRTEAACSKAL